VSITSALRWTSSAVSFADFGAVLAGDWARVIVVESARAAMRIEFFIVGEMSEFLVGL